jgi:thiamine-phosphate pyrophosphorylase
MLFLRSQLRLCYVTDRRLTLTGSLMERCEELINAGVSSIFVRMGDEALEPGMWEQLNLLVQLCQKKNVYCLIENDALLALKLGAHGVYLTKADKSIQRLRELIGPKRFLGVRLDSPDEARVLVSGETRHLIDFCGVGPILQFGEKASSPLGVEQARRISSILQEKPHVWMGGIRADDLNQFGKCFADGVCVARSLEMQQDVVNEVRMWHRVLASCLGPSMWSVGHPPEDVTFRFSHLSRDELQSNRVPTLKYCK